MLTKGQKAELDKTLLAHKAGKLKYYTLDSAKKMVRKNDSMTTSFSGTFRPSKNRKVGIQNDKKSRKSLYCKSAS